MTRPWNAAIAYANLADGGIVRASSASQLAPPARLQNPHVARKWRGDNNPSEYLTVDLGDVHDVDTVAIMGLTLTAAGTIRVRASATDTSALMAEAYDSGPITGAVDPRYGMLVHLLPVLVQARYVRIDLEQPGATYIEAGRLFVGRRWQFAYNFGFGWGRGYVDLSKRTQSRGGQTYVDPNVSFRTVSLSFEVITEAQRLSFVDDVDRLNGQRVDVLLVTNPASPNLGRDSIWGLLDDLDPITQPATWIAGMPAYAKAYKISERL
ncbi:hypothetical protein [Methylobacterium sp. PvR107]|uniref:hypothetical protein n=1 Tax=Methylobacterium sp. PvR107 TaxID=2806597 RepID=UPI001AE2BBB3|nr:hypothetical protein [Methylobacterium sp. PvR107]MBP1179962.1 hypothetical protein [Methylobacterium sp. PvR107]